MNMTWPTPRSTQLQKSSSGRPAVLSFSAGAVPSTHLFPFSRRAHPRPQVPVMRARLRSPCSPVTPRRQVKLKMGPRQGRQISRERADIHVRSRRRAGGARPRPPTPSSSRTSHHSSRTCKPRSSRARRPTPRRPRRCRPPARPPPLRTHSRRRCLPQRATFGRSSGATRRRPRRRPIPRSRCRAPRRPRS